MTKTSTTIIYTTKFPPPNNDMCTLNSVSSISTETVSTSSLRVVTYITNKEIKLKIHDEVNISEIENGFLTLHNIPNLSTISTFN